MSSNHLGPLCSSKSFHRLFSVLQNVGMIPPPPPKLRLKSTSLLPCPKEGPLRCQPGSALPLAQRPLPHLCSPPACVLPFPSSLQGPRAHDFPHRHTPGTGTELLPISVSLGGRRTPPAPLVSLRSLDPPEECGMGHSSGPAVPRCPGELAVWLRGVLCMNCFYRVCLDQQSKRNSTSSDRTRLR